MAVRTLAKGTRKLLYFPAASTPADLAAITTAEFAAAIDLTFLTLMENFKFGAAASDTVTEPSLGDVENTSDFDASNFEAEAWFWRYLDANGDSDPATDLAWLEMNTKGATGVLVSRDGPPATAAIASGQTYLAMPVTTDNPLAPENLAGYQKFGQVFGRPGGTKYGIVTGGTAPAPTVTGATPSAAAQGAQVTITGTWLAGFTSVKFGAVEASAKTSVGNHTIVAVVPAGSAGVANITVTTPGGLSNAFAYTRGA